MSHITELKIKLDKSELNKFVELPFDVGEDIETLKINYKYDGNAVSSLKTDEQKNVIDIALIGPKGIQIGASGSNKNSFSISEYDSTPSYENFEIVKGTYTVVLGIAQIKDSGVEVTVTVEMIEKNYRWIKGDLHCHSINSDGVYDTYKLAHMAKDSGLDFLALTDHNNLSGNKNLPIVDGLTFIPGVEHTHFIGHANYIGVERPFKNHVVNDYEEFKKVLLEAKTNGALISLNHPKCSLCPWLFKIEPEIFDTVEVWNGPMRTDNANCIKWWHNEILLKGYKLPAVGGSDLHKDYGPVKLLAKPTTYVYAKSKGAKDILEAIKEGKVVVTNSPKASLVTLKYGDATIGDTITIIEGEKLEIAVDKLKRGHILKVYNNDKIILSYKAKRGGSYIKEIDYKFEAGFIRAEIEYLPKFFMRIATHIVMYFMLKDQWLDKVPPFIYTLTNPIYLDNK